VTALRKGLLWMLLDETEQAVELLFVRTQVPLEAWRTWASNPQTWRIRPAGNA